MFAFWNRKRQNIWTEC